MERKSLHISSTRKQGENWDDTFQLMSWWDSTRVQESVVMVVGAGALGNEVLKNLALMNVGHILIVDFDIIEYSNLCRSVLFREEDVKEKGYKAEKAADRVRELNPNVKVQVIPGDILIDVGLGVFRRMDTVIGCLDNRIARLHINRYAHRVGKTWIDGAIENLAGQFCVYTPEIACYECNLTDVDWQNIRAKMGCADIAQRNSAAGKVPTTPISSSIIAGMQVQEALKVIHGFEKQIMNGQHFKYDGMNNWIMTYDTDPLRDICDSHYTIPEEDIIEAKDLSHKSTIKETLTWCKKKFKEDVSLQLNYKVILEVTTMESEESKQIIIAEPHFSEDMQIKLQKRPGENVGITKYTDEIDKGFPNLDIPLSQVGVPPLQILSVQTGDDIKFVELTGDKDFLRFT